MSRRIWITGTDTGVGKTVIAAALLYGLRQHGVDTVPMKPVETGCNPESTDTDLDFALAVAGVSLDATDTPFAHPYRLPDACSPHLAAERAGRVIDPDHIRAALAALAARHACVLVEGAGGVLVPVTRAYTLLDVLCGHIDAAVVVARPGLGTLNHTLLTLRALRDRNVPIAGVVCSGARAEDWIEADNLRTLRELAGTPVHAFPPLRTASTTPGYPPPDAVRAAAATLDVLLPALCLPGVPHAR